MRRVLLFACVLSACLVGISHARGVNFSWGTVCYTEAPGNAWATVFACHTNSSSRSWTMTASFMLDTDMPDFIGVELVILGQSDRSTLPDWWKLGAAPDCRAGMARFGADYSGVSSETCWDWTGGLQCEVFSYTWDTYGTQIVAAAALDTLHPIDILAGAEYYAGGVTITNGSTVGTGACGGCAYGFLWGLASVTALGHEGRRDEQTGPIPGGNQCLVWNTAYNLCSPVHAPNLKAGVPAVPCGATASRQKTWGAIKSLYR
jgi:hypothetical protein